MVCRDPYDVASPPFESDFDCPREANFPIRKRAGVIGEK
jgi:hypothetical protein